MQCRPTVIVIGNDGFGLALANAVQAGEGSHIGCVDIDSGVLGVGKTGNQAEQQNESCEKRLGTLRKIWDMRTYNNILLVGLVLPIFAIGIFWF